MSLKAARTLWLSVNLADYTVRCVRVPYTCFGTFEAYSERNVMNCGVTLTNFFLWPLVGRSRRVARIEAAALFVFNKFLVRWSAYTRTPGNRKALTVDFVEAG